MMGDGLGPTSPNPMGTDDTRLVRDGDDDAQDATETSAHEVEVPWERLSAAALRGVIEEFVTREGTEYGAVDVPLETKVGEVRGQIERGDVVVLFDARSGSVNLVRSIERRTGATRGRPV